MALWLSGCSGGPALLSGGGEGSGERDEDTDDTEGAGGRRAGRKGSSGCGAAAPWRVERPHTDGQPTSLGKPSPGFFF